MTMTTPPSPRQVVITTSQGWGEGVCVSWDDWEQRHHSVLQYQESSVSVNEANCIGILMVSFQHTCQLSLYFSPNMWILWILWSQHNINTPSNNQIQICDLLNELQSIALCAHYETTTDISVQRYLHIYSTYLQLPMSALHCHVSRPNNLNHICCSGETQ